MLCVLNDTKQGILRLIHKNWRETKTGHLGNFEKSGGTKAGHLSEMRNLCKFYRPNHQHEIYELAF